LAAAALDEPAKERALRALSHLYRLLQTHDRSGETRP
jgi:hypothetical protein